MNQPHKRSKLMDTTTLVLAAVAVMLMAIAFGQRRDLPLAGLLAEVVARWL